MGALLFVRWSSDGLGQQEKRNREVRGGDVDHPTAGKNSSATERKAQWWVYVLRCCDGSLYTGATVDVHRRLRAHASGKGAAYTRSHLPVALAYAELVGSKSDALRREIQIKALKRSEKLALVATFDPEAFSQV